MANKFLKVVEKLRPHNKAQQLKNLPLMFFFTDRFRVKNIFAVIKNLPPKTAVIIREYDLSDNERLEFAHKIMKIRPQKVKILVGKSWEIALKIKADGVHLSDQDLFKNDIQKFRMLGKIARRNFFISGACHRPKSAFIAQKQNFDLTFYSPIFSTSSHLQQKPLGILQLRNLARKNQIPLYALGGINYDNIKSLKSCNIAGIGGITIFDDNFSSRQ